MISKLAPLILNVLHDLVGLMAVFLSHCKCTALQ